MGIPCKNGVCNMWPDKRDVSHVLIRGGYTFLGGLKVDVPLLLALHVVCATVPATHHRPASSSTSSTWQCPPTPTPGPAARRPGAHPRLGFGQNNLSQVVIPSTYVVLSEIHGGVCVLAHSHGRWKRRCGAEAEKRETRKRTGVAALVHWKLSRIFKIRRE